MAWRVVQKMENYTGQAIGSTAIADRYQQALVDLTAAAVLIAMETQGSDNSYSLGPFSVTKGQGSSSSSAAAKFEDRGMEGLQLLGRRVSVFKANG